MLPYKAGKTGLVWLQVVASAAYFQTNRDRYYDRLQRVRTHGAWEEWLAFFLEGEGDYKGNHW